MLLHTATAYMDVLRDTAMLVNSHVVEGNVPLRTLVKLLAEGSRHQRPLLPGMPMGAPPGMTGANSEPSRILEA